MRAAAGVVGLTLLLCTGASAARAGIDASRLVHEAEAKRVLGSGIKTTLTGDGFCTYIGSSSIVLVVTVQTFDSPRAADEAIDSRRERLESEGKALTERPSLGDRALRAQGPRSIEYQIREGRDLVEVALAGEEFRKLSGCEERLLQAIRVALGRLDAR